MRSPPCTATARRGPGRPCTTSPGPGSSPATGRSRSTRPRSGARNPVPWTDLMTWEQRYRLAFAARTALVLWAAVSLAAALAFAALTRWLDQATRWTVFGYTEDGARAVLSTL